MFLKICCSKVCVKKSDRSSLHYVGLLQGGEQVLTFMFTFTFMLGFEGRNSNTITNTNTNSSSNTNTNITWFSVCHLEIPTLLGRH